MEAKFKHLEFIQNVITRMNSNSFLIKGWAITLVSALFGLAAQNSNQQYVMVTYTIIPAFWIMDGFYISQERQYRKLYEEAAAKDVVDFNMNASRFNGENRTWLSGIFSKTLLVFYGVSFLTTLIVMFLIQKS
jgi:hypothetical protein